MPPPARSKTPDGWKLLVQRYRERGIVLALGAGVSLGCRIPMWEELLERIGSRCLGHDGRKQVRDLIESGMTLPAVAGVLEARAPEGARFLDLLREALYRDFPFKSAVSDKEHRGLVEYVQKSNATMRSVAALCASSGPVGAGFAMNERIHAIVNFNVDSVLRSYVRSRYGEYLLRTIEHATKRQRLGRIPVYHMHGFLRFDARDGGADEREVPCVLTEGAYFDFFNRPHSVFNYTFLYLLREYNCLFVGLSMNDENIRRLLHYSTTEHRASGGGDPLRHPRHFAVLRRTTSPHRNDAIDLSLRRLGTRVLWIERFEELPERLAAVYGERWTTVY